jgi:hypothetical protein
LPTNKKADFRRLFYIQVKPDYGCLDYLASSAGAASAGAASAGAASAGAASAGAASAGAASAGASAAGASAAGASAAGASSAGFSPQAVKAKANNAANNAERVIFISLVCMSKKLCTGKTADCRINRVKKLYQQLIKKRTKNQ